ncbi:MAG: hypothetical protein U9N57_03300 [Pseudomonadota bacterium]|nr:hypothetical protein [Pseudomonadota bacterium]
MLKKILAIAFVSIITSCGGGGGGSSSATETPAATQTFSLAKLQSTAIGTIYTSPLTGSDSDGTTYTGSISLANRAETMFNGVLAIPRDLLLNLSGGGIDITVTGTSFVDSSNNNLLQLVIQTTGLTCVPSSPDTIPSTVKAGDFGILSTLVCDDGTTQEINWRVEDSNGNANVITNSTLKDQFNATVSVTNVTYTIDTNGNIIKFKTQSTIQDTGFTLTYSST